MSIGVNPAKNVQRVFYKKVREARLSSLPQGLCFHIAAYAELSALLFSLYERTRYTVFFAKNIGHRSFPLKK